MAIGQQKPLLRTFWTPYIWIGGLWKMTELDRILFDSVAELLDVFEEDAAVLIGLKTLYNLYLIVKELDLVLDKLLVILVRDNLLVLKEVRKRRAS